MIPSSGSKLRRWIGWLVITAALGGVSCSRKPDTSSEGANQPATEATPRSSDEATESAETPRKHGSTLEIGSARRDPGQVLSFPLEFTSGPHESVGTLEAELDVKEGPWKFQKAKLPEGSQGTISAKPGKGKAGEFAIQLEISAGNRELADGVAGYLTFSVNDSGTSEIPITVGRLDTFPPGTEPGETEEKSKSSGELPSTPDSSSPSPGCFFFTH